MEEGAEVQSYTKPPEVNESNKLQLRNIMREQLHQSVHNPKKNREFLSEASRLDQMQRYDRELLRLDRLLDQIPDHLLPMFSNVEKDSSGKDMVKVDQYLFSQEMVNKWKIISGKESFYSTTITIDKRSFGEGAFIDDSDPKIVSKLNLSLERLKTKIQASPSWVEEQNDKESQSVNYAYKPESKLM